MKREHKGGEQFPESSIRGAEPEEVMGDGGSNLETES